MKLWGDILIKAWFLAFVLVILFARKTKAEAFPHCRFPDANPNIITTSYGDIDLNHPDGKAVKAYSLRNYPTHADNTTLGTILHLQACQLAAMRDWIAGYSKEAEGRLRRYRETHGVHPSVIDDPSYPTYSEWRFHNPSFFLIYEWSQALDYSVHFSPIQGVSQWGYQHGEAVKNICLELRNQRYLVWLSYHFVAASIDYELRTYYEPSRPPMPSIPHSTWDKSLSNWGSDAVLGEPAECPIVLGEA